MAAQLSRRGLLKRSALAAVAVGGGAALLSACGSDSTSPVKKAAAAGGPGAPPKASAVTGTAVYLNYPDWIGKDTVANFQAKFPGAKIKQTAAGFDSVSGVAQTVAQNPGAYDMLLADVSIAQQLQAGGFLLPVSEANVPGLKNIEPRLKELYPYGMPLDTGYTGFAYRRDLIDEDLKTWADFWRVAPAHAHKITVVGIDRSIVGAALNLNGADANSTKQADLDAAKKSLLELKPNVLSFKTFGVGQTLEDGSAVMALGYNYDIVPAVQKDPRLVWVTPEEGTGGYVEGIAGVSKTDVADTVRAFMDYCIQPDDYAGFVNLTHSPRTSSIADDKIDKAMLDPLFDLPENVQIFKFLGGEGTKAFSRVWSEVQAH